MNASCFANARDVADLPGWGPGSATRLRPGVLYRSEAPLPGDVAPMQPWPPEVVVDLRSAGESDLAHPLAGASRVVNLPFFGGADPVALLGHRPSLAEVYALMLDATVPQLLAVAELVASAAGPVLLHCAAGKDRTGLAVAVLLTAVGVPEELVVADYVRSGDKRADLLERMAQSQAPPQREAYRARLAEAPAELFDAPAAVIAGVLARLAAHHGGAVGWLAAGGLDPDVLAGLRDRLVLPPPV